MTPKLLLALALVGAVHGEPSAPTKAMTAPATPDKTYTAPASLAAPIKPAEIAVLPAGSPGVPVVLTILWPNDKIDADKHAWLVSEAAKDENKSSIIIREYYHGDEPFFIKHDGKRYEFGLRSDGCVVWRERK